MTADPAAAWLAVGELLDNAGLGGDFDAERERAYRMILQPWEALAIADPHTGEPMPVIVAAVLRVLRNRSDLRFLPPAGIIAEQCRAITGTTLSLAAHAGEAVTAAEQAAYLNGSERDRIDWMQNHAGELAAAWLATIGTQRIRSANLAGDHAAIARRDLEQSYTAYAEQHAQRAVLGLPNTPAAAILERRGAAPISELTREASA